MLLFINKLKSNWVILDHLESTSSNVNEYPHVRSHLNSTEVYVIMLYALLVHCYTLSVISLDFQKYARGIDHSYSSPQNTLMKNETIQANSTAWARNCLALAIQNLNL